MNIDRWDCRKSKKSKSENIDSFLFDLIKVCNEHGYSISHEDGGGSFVVNNINSHDIDWLLSANIGKGCLTNKNVFFNKDCPFKTQAQQDELAFTALSCSRFI